MRRVTAILKSSLSVLIDDQAFLYAARSGMGRYFAELIRQFRGPFHESVETITPFRYVRSLHLSELDADRYKAIKLPDELLRGRGAIVLRWANAARFPRHPPVDVVHHTFYRPERLGTSAAKAHVCTIYDMIPELFPDPSMDAQVQAKKVYAAACDGFICISETTRREFVRIYGDQGKPMAVTPLAVAEAFSRPKNVPSPFSGSYILFVGQRGIYKNFTVLLDAFARLAATDQDLRLVCVGSWPFAPEELERISSLGLTGRVVHALLDDDHLAATYRAAVCFVFPSKCEGFGLPALEACASGCPTLLADTAIFREVGPESALFFGPDDVDGLHSQLERVVADQDLRNRLGEDGVVWAKDFSWERTAQGSLDLYRTLLDNGGAHG